MKRLLDILAGSIGILILSPLMILISVLIKLLDPGPVIYKQKRLGMHGKPFYIYKFRTMVVNAETVLKNDHDLYEKYKKNGFNLDLCNDPRITKLGLFLRQTKLDELPQFINVLKGEMSLVGPRPVVEEETQYYGDYKNVFLSVKPGITGYWQLLGRSEVGYPERVDMELYYVNNQSIWLDIQIIIKTALSFLSLKSLAKQSAVYIQSRKNTAGSGSI